MVKSLLPVILALALTLPAAGMAQHTPSPLARSIENDLDRLESDRIQRTERERGQAARLFAPSEQRSAQDIARSSDLGAAQQDLRTLKTRRPDADSIPLLERQLDRVGRSGRSPGLYQPSRDPAALYAR
jgi:hypothetical protein